MFNIVMVHKDAARTLCHALQPFGTYDELAGAVRGLFSNGSPVTAATPLELVRESLKLGSDYVAFDHSTFDAIMADSVTQLMHMDSSIERLQGVLAGLPVALAIVVPAGPACSTVQPPTHRCNGGCRAHA